MKTLALWILCILAVIGALALRFFIELTLNKDFELNEYGINLVGSMTQLALNTVIILCFIGLVKLTKDKADN